MNYWKLVFVFPVVPGILVALLALLLITVQQVAVVYVAILAASVVYAAWSVQVIRECGGR